MIRMTPASIFIHPDAEDIIRKSGRHERSARGIAARSGRPCLHDGPNPMFRVRLLLNVELWWINGRLESTFCLQYSINVDRFDIGNETVTTQATLRPIPKKSLRDEAYDELRRGIVSGGLRPGQQLSELQLAAQFQISRSPIREALGRLELEGFAIRRPNGRVYVAPLDIAELEQLYAVRATVEGLATRLAAPRLTTDDLDEMTADLQKMGALAERGDIEGSLARGAEFHDVILGACANEPLVEIIAGLRLRISRYRTMIAATRNQQIRIAEHQDILNALYARNAKGAEAAMIRHIEESADIILKALS
ncbi:MAG: GntR family transcriptional regulator [Rhodospirillales bacterium]